jgi:HD superfamily phosphohydrolase
MSTTKIKCPVEGIIDLDRLPGVSAEKIRHIIDAPELQRLRRIRQLGFTERVYPGATHSRFAHSLGAFQGAQRALSQLKSVGCDIPDEWYVATALACLLHDIGHGPFSHTFESISGQSHESRTFEILRSGPVIPDVLEAVGGGTRDRVLQLVRTKVEIQELRYLADLVSSALDCDRMDYLRRDALYTGAHYGVFDRDWLIREMVPTQAGSAVVVVEKGRTAVEQYLIGRYHMFQNVYLHKTSRGFETAFRGLCRRVRALGIDILPEAAVAFRALFDEPLSLQTFLGLNDGMFENEIVLLLESEDPTVRALASALNSRRPLRQRTSRSGAEDLGALRAARMEEAAGLGLDPECAVWSDTAKDVPYRPYAPSQGRKGLRILQRNGELVDITELSPTLAGLAEPIEVHRVYWVEASA